ncbi:hypothetical protein [Altererythrobacter sp.]|uniref:hypothetical protein n=1 Tax=Altererythrobacter sp. TaxID=1872480 RepID=UPI003D05DDF3
MPIMNKKAVLLAGTVATALTAEPAYAYMGAGAGLSALGSILSFLGVFLLMLFGFVWFPLKRALSRKKDKSEGTDTAEIAAEDGTEEDA